MKDHLIPLHKLWPSLNQVWCDYVGVNPTNPNESIMSSEMRYFSNDAMLKIEEYLLEWGYDVSLHALSLDVDLTQENLKKINDSDQTFAFLYLIDHSSQEVFYPLKSNGYNLKESGAHFMATPSYVINKESDYMNIIASLRADLKSNYPKNEEILDHALIPLHAQQQQKVLHQQTTPVVSAKKGIRL